MKQLSLIDSGKPIRITTQLLERYDSLEEMRLKLQRQASDLKKEIDDIEKALFPVVLERCKGDTRRIESCGHELSINSEPCSVSWKKEFIRVAGQAEADRLIKEQPMKDYIEIKKL